MQPLSWGNVKVDKEVQTEVEEASETSEKSIPEMEENEC
jgi:hypothetical protein